MNSGQGHLSGVENPTTMNILVISIWLCYILIGAGVLGIAWAGISSLVNGKFRSTMLVGMLVPLGILGITYVLNSSKPEPMIHAGISTALLLLALSGLALLILGLKSALRF